MTVVVITGSTRGFGYYIAQHLANKNYKVIIHSRQLKNCKNAVKMIKKEIPHARLEYVACDIQDPNCSSKIIKKAKSKFDSIDIWINNAGTCCGKRSQLNSFDNREIQEIINTNVTGVLMSSNSIIKEMSKQPKGGKIFNLEGCGTNNEIVPGFLAYSISKNGMRYINKFLNRELINTNIKVFNISPGIMKTDFINQENSSKIYNFFIQEPEDVAKLHDPLYLDISEFNYLNWEGN